MDPSIEGAGLPLVLGELGSPLHHSGTLGVLVQQPQARLGLGLLDWSLQATKQCWPPHLRSPSSSDLLSSSSFTLKLMNQISSLHRLQALLRDSPERLRDLRYLSERKRKQIPI